jgi:hypothetical protein
MLTPNGEVTNDKIRDVLNLGRESGQSTSSAQIPEEILDFSFLREIRRERLADHPAKEKSPAPK